MKESLRRDRLMENFGELHAESEGLAPEPVGDSESPVPEDYMPSRLRGRREKRAVLPPFLMSLFKTLIAVAALIAIVCLVDFPSHRQWVEVTRTLQVLRDHPSAPEYLKLEELSSQIDDTDVDLKCGVEGVLAIRKVGLGPREEGLRACEAVIARFPGGWVSPYLARDGFYGGCDKCRGSGHCADCNGAGSHKGNCYLCAGKGKCMKCGGTGILAGGRPQSRPSGGGFARNTGRITTMEQPCLVCRGSGKCPNCAGNRQVSKNCPSCDGVGNCLVCKGGKHVFSSVRVTEQYRNVIDGIAGLHPKWIIPVLEFQAWLRGVMTGTTI